MEITMMWKLAGAALAAAAIATAPIAGAAPSDNTPNPNAMQRCTTGTCHARQVISNLSNPAANKGLQTALDNIGGPRARQRA
jgi:hypothetical protein